MGKGKHRNDETVVKCPVDGCNAEKLSRAIHLHVRQSSGNGHGPHGDVPESLDMENLEKVGTQTVEMDYPEDREVDNVARLCPVCGKAFNGFRGVQIHLGQVQGRGVHSDDAPEKYEKDDFPIAEVDEDMNVINIVEEAQLMPSTQARIEGKDSIPISDVQNFIDGLKEDGEDEFAERAENELL